jgi:hypothetical protein
MLCGNPVQASKHMCKPHDYIEALEVRLYALELSVTAVVSCTMTSLHPHEQLRVRSDILTTVDTSSRDGLMLSQRISVADTLGLVPAVNSTSDRDTEIACRCLQVVYRHMI